MVREKKNEYKFNTNQAMKKENKETLKQQKKNKRNRSEKWLKKKPATNSGKLQAASLCY